MSAECRVPGCGKYATEKGLCLRHLQEYEYWCAQNMGVIVYTDMLIDAFLREKEDDLFG